MTYFLVKQQKELDAVDVKKSGEKNPTKNKTWCVILKATLFFLPREDSFEILFMIHGLVM